MISQGKILLFEAAVGITKYNSKTKKILSFQIRQPFTLMQIPQPIQSVSEIQAILLCDTTSMQSFPGEKKSKINSKKFLQIRALATKFHRGTCN